MYDWKLIAVGPKSSIKETLVVMDKAALQIVLVISDKNSLLGTVTDGDIRRGLLAGESLESPVERVMNHSPVVGLLHEKEVFWKQKLEKNQFKSLPIIDGVDNRIIGLFCQKREIKCHKNPVVLMLGGLGTRLRPLTEKIPKPMLTIGGQPILETIVRHIAEQGFEEFYFCINYLGEQIKEHFGDGTSIGIRIHYIEENNRMGTAGALSLLPVFPDLPFIVMNGDLLTKVDLSSLLNFHQEYENEVTLCVREYSQQVPYGVVEMERNYVTQLVEKPVYRYFVNGGIYVLNPAALKHVPDKTFYDMPDLIEDVHADKKLVGGFPITEYWMDIGKIPDYYQAQADYEVHFSKRNELIDKK